MAGLALVDFVAETVELGAAEPVLPGEVHRVLHAQAALLGRVHEEEAAEGPVRLPTEVRGVLLIDDGDPLPPTGELMGRHQAGQTRPDHDRVGLPHGASPR